MGELPPPAAILKMIMGTWVAQSIGAAARFGVADHLASGAKSAGEIASAAGTNPDATFRLMRALCSIGVFACSGEGSSAVFSNNALSEALRSNVPGSMRNIAMAETDRCHWLTWGRFPEAIRTGQKQPVEATGMEPWDYYGKHRDEGEQFSRAMADISGMAMGPVLETYDFSSVRKLVDVGGAHGTLLAAILKQYPTIKGVLFDLPHAQPGGRAAMEQAGLANRVEAIGGDFFASVPAGGDLYLLKHILHDWNDERCVAILKNIRAAMAPGAKVVVVELALPPGAEPAPAQLMDLNMLVMLDGRERTAQQYGALFEKSGLRLTRYIPTPSPIGICEAEAA